MEMRVRTVHGYERCCAQSTCSSRICDDTGDCIQKALPRGDCTTPDDCYDGHPCLGGKCCSFTETMHATTNGLFSACVACGGAAVGYYSSDWSTALGSLATQPSGTEGDDYHFPRPRVRVHILQGHARPVHALGLQRG